MLQKRAELTLAVDNVKMKPESKAQQNLTNSIAAPRWQLNSSYAIGHLALYFVPVARGQLAPTGW
jgi:hypothetical protein